MDTDNSNMEPQDTSAPTGTGLDRNLAGALSYVLGPITGVLFVMLERDRFVRFHAFQSIFLFVAWIVFWIGFNVLTAVVGMVPGLGFLMVIIGLLLGLVLGLGAFILWIVLMIRAYQGQTWKLPVIGDMAERYAAATPRPAA